MDDFACQVIKAAGGTGTVSEITRNPLSTVSSWKRTGLTAARLDHIVLAVRVRKPEKLEQLAEAIGSDHSGRVIAEPEGIAGGNGGDISAQAVA